MPIIRLSFYYEQYNNFGPFPHYDFVILFLNFSLHMLLHVKKYGINNVHLKNA